MSSRTFPLIGGSRFRLTALDLCGAVAYGNLARLVSKGFVSVAVTANYNDGTEITVDNANGERCVQRSANPELLNYSLAITFCAVDPAAYTMVTGFPPVYDPATGDLIGFSTDRAVRPNSVRNALELWSDAQGDAACDDTDTEVPYAYLLWPNLSGGRPGDYTIENAAVTFSVTGMLTRDGSRWDLGPYLVQTDEDGEPGPLVDPITATMHDRVMRVTVAPPEPTDGRVPLDDPDTAAATTATAGSPGSFNGFRPADLAGLTGVTASPATAWVTGQHVILGEGDLAHWDGDSWAAGRAA